MVSIFIWKADTPLSASSCPIYLRYYHGADWFLEESSDTDESVSYQYIHQRVTPEYIHYTAKKMGTDWMGHTLLEEMEIPYKRWKEENDLCVEQLGSWNRVILPVSFSGGSMEDQWTCIQQWITEGIYPSSALPVLPVLPVVPVVPVLPALPLSSPSYSGYKGRGGHHEPFRNTTSSYPDHSNRGRGGQRGGGGRGGRGWQGRGGQGRGGQGRGGHGGGRGGHGGGRGGQGRVNLSI